MGSATSDEASLSLFRRRMAAAALIWTVVVGGSLVTAMQAQHRQSVELAINEARASFNKDMSFRLWATSHGGVYVPPDDTTPPNPYLSHLAERDVLTTSGKKLTLMNPAYMLRQMAEGYSPLFGAKSHITSLKLRNPHNAPDAWETAALKRLDAGEEEVSEVVDTDGEPSLRLIRPMMVVQGCLKCHSDQGYKVGDVRGGLTVTVALKTYLDAGRRQQDGLLVAHGAIWLLGIVGIGIGWREGRRHIRRQAAAVVALGESEERFRVIFELAAVGIANIDESGRLTAVNDQLCQITGYSREELQSRTMSEITHPEDRDGDARQYLDLRAGLVNCITMEKRYVRKDGKVVWVKRMTSAAQPADGGPPHFITVVEDIQLRKEAEAGMQRSLEELTRSNTELSRFAFVASHDLQEPLRTVISYSQLLERRLAGRLDGPESELLAFMVDGARRMRELVRDLLDYSRANAQIAPFRPVSMDEVVRTALNNLGALIEETGASVTVAPLPLVEADQIQMLTLIENLLGNAFKFHHPDRPPVVGIEAETHDGEVLFSVTDNGLGIDPAYRDDIFVIFKRLHTAAAYPGTGIGLALCKRMVERHHGHIWVDPAPGGGSVFRFTLPAADPAQPKADLTPAGATTF